MEKGVEQHEDQTMFFILLVEDLFGLLPNQTSLVPGADPVAVPVTQFVFSCYLGGRIWKIKLPFEPKKLCFAQAPDIFLHENMCQMLQENIPSPGCQVWNAAENIRWLRIHGVGPRLPFL